MGCCVMEDECFLVYEFCPNGNLSERLFGIIRFNMKFYFLLQFPVTKKLMNIKWCTTGKDEVLTRIQRLEVAIDSARGLWFLHTYPEGCIVHRDIKVCQKNVVLPSLLTRSICISNQETIWWCGLYIILLRSLSVEVFFFFFLLTNLSPWSCY